MIQTYSATIRRKEMEAVLTCMVDEKIGPGDMNVKLIQTLKENMGCDGAAAFRSPAIALEYAFKALDLPQESGVMISALAPAYQIIAIEKSGYKPIVLDVQEADGLVSVDSVSKGIEKGGRLLILHENMGILPKIKEFLALQIPIIEDISQSVFARYPFFEDDEASKKSSLKEGVENAPILGKCAGLYGVYALLGMEDNDIITSGGGAVLIAPGRREWTVLRHLYEEAPSTDMLSDMNAALAWVETKEFLRNEKTRKELFALYSRSCMSGRHKTFARGNDDESTVCTFPLVLNSGFKDVKSYAQRKGVEIRQVYENSIIAMRQEELSSECICANSLLLRTASFPLYPRLSQKDANLIVKVLSSLP